MKESKSSIFFKILVIISFIAGLFNMLTGNSTLGLLFLIFTVTIIILEIVLDIREKL